jgi:putative transposase
MLLLKIKIMPKPNRIVIQGIPHHVTQRGNNCQPVFLDDEDRRLYLEILKERCILYKLLIHGYCLMTNHVHLAVTPLQLDSLASAIGYSHRLFAQRSNSRHYRKGHLWENRFYSCPLDESHFITALIYIDRNPVRAGLVEIAHDYPWSSAKAHLGELDNSGLIDPQSWQRIAKDYDWKEIIRQEEKQNALDELRKHTLSGHPLGKLGLH